MGKHGWYHLVDSGLASYSAPEVLSGRTLEGLMLQQQPWQKASKGQGHAL